VVAVRPILRHNAASDPDAPLGKLAVNTIVGRIAALWFVMIETLRATLSFY
jgi:hypothetical protein